MALTSILGHVLTIFHLSQRASKFGGCINFGVVQFLAKPQNLFTRFVIFYLVERDFAICKKLLNH